MIGKSKADVRQFSSRRQRSASVSYAGLHAWATVTSPVGVQIRALPILLAADIAWCLRHCTLSTGDFVVKQLQLSRAADIVGGIPTPCSSEVLIGGPEIYSRVARRGKRSVLRVPASTAWTSINSTRA